MGIRVLIVDANASRSLVLEQGLLEAGCEVVGVLGADEDLLECSNRLRPDMIIIDMELPDRDTLETIRVVNAETPRPVVLFAERSDAATIQDAISAGVSAYVVAGLAKERIESVLEVAIARFRAFQTLRSELAEARSQLEERKDVERAKGLLMQKRGLSEAEAYRLLRKTAMDRNQRLGEVARQLLAMAELLG